MTMKRLILLVATLVTGVALALTGCMTARVQKLPDGTLDLQYRRLLMKLDVTYTTPDGMVFHLTSDPKPAVDLSANALAELAGMARSATLAARAAEVAP